MNDYDIFIKEMIDETIKPDGELSALARKFYEAGYEHCKQQAPKGLPGVTADEVDRMLGEEWDHLDRFSLPYTIEKWFNDPNRDAPVNPTMHPDLEWLASLPEETVRRATIGLGGSPLIYRGTWGVNGIRAARYAPADKQSFTLAEIEQARRHLAKVGRHDAPVKPTMSREGALEALRGFFCYEPQAYRNAIVSDMAADAKVLARALQVLAEEDQMLKAPPHVGVRKDVGGRFDPDRDAPGIDMTNATVRTQEETVEFNYKPTAEYECGHEATITDHAIPFMCPECGDGTFTTATGLRPETEYRVTFTGVAEDGPEASDAFTTKTVLHPDDDPELDVYVLGLNNLPDYETWFEDHGSDHMTPYRPQDRPATVHELYTHFRARLLDELRQAGVIGDER